MALPNIHCLLDRHVAITAFTDLIDGHMAHMPFAQFAANSAWALCATIAHNLRRAAARGGTLRRRLVNIPARLARPNATPAANHNQDHTLNPPNTASIGGIRLGVQRPAMQFRRRPSRRGSRR